MVEPHSVTSVWGVVGMGKGWGTGKVSLRVPHPFCGGVAVVSYFSHTLSGAVPSALVGLASGFGMGPGVSLPL